MSPTRRDLLKASAGVVSAALAGSSFVPSVAGPQIEATEEILPLGHIRNAEVWCVASDRGSTDGDTSMQFYNLYLDGDLDNSWTVWVTPGWQTNAITGDRDRGGIIDCRDLTGSEVLSRIWQESHQPRPRILHARHGGRFMSDLGESDNPELRTKVRDWWKRTNGSFKDRPEDDKLNDQQWSLVMWNHPILDAVPDANAVIECHGWFYLAQLDKEPVSIPGVS